MMQTNTLIIGSSIAGLASAAALQKQGIEYVVIEKQSQVAAPWRNHYERLHLHTNKRLSNLPYKKFGNKIPLYPSRQQVIGYLEDYQKEFGIRPVFNTEALSIKKENRYWITETTSGIFKSRYLVMATGAYGKPKPVSFKGMESFPGKIMHSCIYKNGKEFKAKKILVVGFGNSACEIAIDLYEQGAIPSMSVRSPVNVIPRDVFGIPVLEISLLMSKLSPRMADNLNAPLLKLLLGDITKLGLKRKAYGPFEEIQKNGSIPLLDIGTIRHIRQKHIRVLTGIDHIEENTVHFTDGKKEDFDAIVAGIGYYRNYNQLVNIDNNRFEDLKVCADQQKFFGKDGLYFCGFFISPTGAIREIGLEALKIAKDIAGKKVSDKSPI
jgi:indole-3-pyruvate monooxygenase